MFLFLSSQTFTVPCDASASLLLLLLLVQSCLVADDCWRNRIVESLFVTILLVPTSNYCWYEDHSFAFVSSSRGMVTTMMLVLSLPQMHMYTNTVPYPNS